MALDDKDYKELLEDIRYRKGEYYVSKVEELYSNIKIIPSGKHATYKQKYQLYRLEANVRWEFYRYLENIEKSFFAALASKNNFLINNPIKHSDKINLRQKMYAISGVKLMKNLSWPIRLRLNNKIYEIQGGPKHAKYYLNYLEQCKIFKKNFLINFEEQAAINNVRNAVQHFDFLFNKNLNQDLRTFLSIFSPEFQESFLVYVISHIALAITDSKFRMMVIDYVLKSWFEDNITPLIKDFIQEIRLDYKSTAFYQKNKLEEFNKQRIIDKKPTLSPEEWVGYCIFQDVITICGKYKDITRNKIHDRNIINNHMR